MAQLSVRQLSKNFGITPILEQIAFQVNEKDKIGIVGFNGSGKTTLMRMLVGELEPDSGSIYRRGDLKIGYVQQNVHIESERTVYEECKKAYADAFRIEREMKQLERRMGELVDDVAALDEVVIRYNLLMERFEQAGGLSYHSEITGMLKGMGFDEAQFDCRVNHLSGGEKSRLELAIMLLGRPDLLMLDEPTNHLDMDAVSFLEGFLADFRGAILLISHDRYFLNKVVNRIFLIENHRLYAYDCGYAAYTERRRKDLEVYRHAYENQQAEIARQKEIIERLSKLGGSKRKRGISQSRSRQKLLDKMVLMEAPPDEKRQMSLRFEPRYPSGNDVLSAEGLTKSFGERMLFRDVGFLITRGETVGLIGENGAGKTTLLRMIQEQLAPDSGRLRYGAALKMAFFDQEQQTLDDDKTVLDELWDAYPRLNHFEVRAYLAKFQFVGDDIFRMVGELSGGEKARIALLKLMISSANFLLLDEPTNHLDIESREILEEALQHYDGTCLVISHDRYFLNRVCSAIFRLTPTGMEIYQGNYDDYLQAQREPETVAPAAEGNKTRQRKEERKKRMEQKQLRQLRAQSNALAKSVEALEAELEALETAAYDPSLYEDHVRAKAHHDRIEAVQRELEAQSQNWFEVQLMLEEEEA